MNPNLATTTPPTAPHSLSANSVSRIMLTVLVTLGMVAAVQAVRRTVDIVSTLMAVAVGLGLTLGPLALQAR